MWHKLPRIRECKFNAIKRMTKNVKRTRKRKRLNYDSDIRARCSGELKERVLRYAEKVTVDEADILRWAVTEYMDRVAPEKAPDIKSEPAPVGNPAEATSVIPKKKPRPSLVLPFPLN